MKTVRDPSGTKPSDPPQQDRRKRVRYRYTESMIVHLGDSSMLPGISVEISESGMSAVVPSALRVGQSVELEPVAGGKIAGVVRHKLGQLYGFEFVGLSAEQARKIGETCEKFGLHRHKQRDSDFKR